MKRKKWLITGCSVLIGIATLRMAQCSACEATVVKATEAPAWKMNTVNGEIPSLDDQADLQHEYPQTIVHDAVMEFLSAPLSEGKTKKKVIVLGYDGFRRDGLSNLADDAKSGVKKVAQVGRLYLSFAGGDGELQQPTSTAPGWTSILTGVWSDLHGVLDNGFTKSLDVDSFLTKAARMGYSSVFVASWADHFTTSYVADILQAEIEGIDVAYIQKNNDEETKREILHFVEKEEEGKTEKDDPDVIFFTFEASDHAGHHSGYGNEYEDYRLACRGVDEWGGEIIDKIWARSSYNEEEWLIMITSDHGGIKEGHGGHTYEEEATFLVANIPLDQIIHK